MANQKQMRRNRMYRLYRLNGNETVENMNGKHETVKSIDTILRN